MAKRKPLPDTMPSDWRPDYWTVNESFKPGSYDIWTAWHRMAAWGRTSQKGCLWRRFASTQEAFDNLKTEAGW